MTLLLTTFHARSAWWSLLLLLALLGCQTHDTPTASPELEAPYIIPAPSEADRDSARALLARAQPAAIDSAFARLQTTPYTQLQRTLQFDEIGQVQARSEQRLRIIPQNAELTAQPLEAEQEGEFQFGWIERFFTLHSPEEARLITPRHLVPDDAAYLAPRNFEHYHYRLIADTTINGQPAIGAEAVLRPDADDRPNERHGLVLLHRSGHQLMHFSGLVVRQTLLFDERSRTRWTAAVDAGLSEQPVPRHSSTHTRMRLPFGSPREIKFEREYHDAD